MKKLIACAAFGIFYGCGFFESDATQTEMIVEGNFKVAQQEGSVVHNLIFANTPEIGTVIVEDCATVVYDSLNRKIFCSQNVTAGKQDFVKVDILDTTSEVVQPYRQTAITSEEFDTETKDCAGCKVIYAEKNNP